MYVKDRWWKDSGKDHQVQLRYSCADSSGDTRQHHKVTERLPPPKPQPMRLLFVVIK